MPLLKLHDKLEKLSDGKGGTKLWESMKLMLKIHEWNKFQELKKQFQEYRAAMTAQILAYLP